MREVNLHFAKTHLSRLVDEALAGEEVVIARNGTALVKLTPVEARGRQRVLGKDQGKIVMVEDFDAPMPELEALFYTDPLSRWRGPAAPGPCPSQSGCADSSGSSSLG